MKNNNNIFKQNYNHLISTYVKCRRGSVHKASDGGVHGQARIPTEPIIIVTSPVE